MRGDSNTCGLPGAGFSKEHRATLSHHASAVHGSDIVYSREWQVGSHQKAPDVIEETHDRFRAIFSSERRAAEN